jgi:hypothetical protein
VKKYWYEYMLNYVHQLSHLRRQIVVQLYDELHPCPNSRPGQQMNPVVDVDNSRVQSWLRDGNY